MNKIDFLIARRNASITDFISDDEVKAICHSRDSSLNECLGIDIRTLSDHETVKLYIVKEGQGVIVAINISIPTHKVNHGAGFSFLTGYLEGLNLSEIDVRAFKDRLEDAIRKLSCML